MKIKKLRNTEKRAAFPYETRNLLFLDIDRGVKCFFLRRWRGEPAQAEQTDVDQDGQGKLDEEGRFCGLVPDEFHGEHGAKSEPAQAARLTNRFLCKELLPA